MHCTPLMTTTSDSLNGAITMTTITPPPPSSSSSSLPPGSPLPPPGGEPAGGGPSGRPPAPARFSTGTRRALTVAGVGLAAVVALQAGLLVVDLLARRERVETFAFTGDLEALRIRSDSGSIRVIGSDRDDIAVTATIREGLADADVRAVQADGTLRLDTDCGPFFVPTTCGVNFVVEVPARLSTTISTSAGGVRVQSMSGRVDVDAGAGSIRLDDLSGVVEARSAAGSITGTALRSLAVEADSSAGSVRLSFAAAPEAVRAKSSAGGVTVEVPEGDELYRVEASADGGDERVRVRTDPRSDRVITARSSAGSVTVRYVEP
jgi:hypothetical protein